jgi:hypothetical protein
MTQIPNLVSTRIATEQLNNYPTESAANIRTLICASRLTKTGVWKSLKVIGMKFRCVLGDVYTLGRCIEYLLASGRMHISTETEGTDN